MKAAFDLKSEYYKTLIIKELSQDQHILPFYLQIGLRLCLHSEGKKRSKCHCWKAIAFVKKKEAKK